MLSWDDWRTVFYLSGLVGVAWTLWWWREYFVPATHPRLHEAERQVLAPVIHASGGAEGAPRWLSLLRLRQTWGVVVAKFFSDAAWYLLDHGFGYGVVFTLAGSFHVLAFAIICVAIPTIRSLSPMGGSGVW